MKDSREPTAFHGRKIIHGHHAFAIPRASTACPARERLGGMDHGSGIRIRPRSEWLREMIFHGILPAGSAPIDVYQTENRYCELLHHRPPQ